MGREKVVSREFLVNNVDFKCFNSESAQLEDKIGTLTKYYDDINELLKTLNKLTPNNITVVQVLNQDKKTELRLMRETDFLKCSILADSETRKPIEKYKPILVGDEIEQFKAKLLQEFKAQYNITD